MKLPDYLKLTASSRALKYLPRGFSLALPPAALRVLEKAELDFTKTIKEGKDRAKHDTELRNVPNPSIARTDELAGLAGLLRREANLERKSGEVSKPVAFESALDYGLKNSSWLKPITEDDLKTLENGVLAHDYWEYHINEVAPGLGVLLIDVDKAVAAGKKRLPGAPVSEGPPVWMFGASTNYVDYVVPYVASFDREFVLGLKKQGDDPFHKTWTQIRDVQYIFKMPVSLIPIVEKAEQKMEELLAGGFDTTDASAPVPKSTVEVPELSTKVSDSINALFSDAGNRIFSHVSKTGSIDASKKFLPSSFPGPCRRTGPAGAAAFAHVGVKRMMTPLIGADGREIKPKKDLSHAYRVATIAGLWQFKGLDKDIDKALNLIWQAWSITARAALSLPVDKTPMLFYMNELETTYEEARSHLKSGDTTRLAETLGELSDSERALLITYLEQRTTPEIVEQMNFDLAGLKQTIEALKSSPTVAQSRVGEWDEERKRFLVEWMRGEEMI